MGAFPPSIICYGRLDNFNPSSCQAQFDSMKRSTNFQDMSTPERRFIYECGFWKLYKLKCKMGRGDELHDPRCWAVKEITLRGNRPHNAGRTCNGVLEGLNGELITFNDMQREIPGEAIPTERHPVRWFLGGIDINYELEYYDGWECGDLFQPPDRFFGGTYNMGDLVNDPEDSRNDYKWWFLMVYAHEVAVRGSSSGDFRPALFNQWRELHPKSPFHLYKLDDKGNFTNGNIPMFTACPPSKGAPPGDPEPLPPVCCGCGNCPNLHCMPIAPRDAGDASAMSKECEGIVDEMVQSGSQGATDCECVNVQQPKPPIVYPPPPTTVWPPPVWSPGHGITWLPERDAEEGQWTWGGSGSGNVWGGGGGGGGWGGGWGGGGGGGGGGDGEYKPQVPICSVSIRVDCPRTEKDRLRIICCDNEADYRDPTAPEPCHADNPIKKKCEDVVIPMKKDKIETGEEEVQGLEDATYYTPVRWR